MKYFNKQILSSKIPKRFKVYRNQSTSPVRFRGGSYKIEIILSFWYRYDFQQEKNLLTLVDILKFIYIFVNQFKFNNAGRK